MIAKRTYVNEHTNTEDDNILSMYLKEINKISLLTREEEVEIATKAASGNEAAKKRLIESNLRFVVNVAKKYQNQGLPLIDLINEGNIGLMNAIDRFDVDKGYHFISYAVWWIRQAILKAICEKSRAIRLPLNRANELIQIQKAQKELTSMNMEEPDLYSIAQMTQLDEGHIADLLSISRDMVSLETPVFTDNNNSELGDFIEDSDYTSPEESLVENAMRDDINTVLNTLSIKESEIIEYRFGLNGRHAMSLKEIGDIYNLTKERIRQIEKKALERLRHPSRSKYLEAYSA
ncbi:MAG: RNA polymerase sigma factor RpoD/SigA [Candidatus Brocadiales bacterium]|nr:RNA polymerase sigma factor RpoD/SigA [Candidatus Brocadiales bacterium]MBL7005458.1 RNA polymerase sigma factor RpoD/SigA [Spirochaetia bacterium]